MIFNYCPLCNYGLKIYGNTISCRNCKKYMLKFNPNGSFHIEDYVLDRFAIETCVEKNILKSSIFEYTSSGLAEDNSGGYKIILTKNIRISPEYARKLLIVS